jgi:hypothetical protein
MGQNSGLVSSFFPLRVAAETHKRKWSSIQGVEGIMDLDQDKCFMSLWIVQTFSSC